MADIYLREGQATPSDVGLYDPTTADAGGPAAAPQLEGTPEETLELALDGLTFTHTFAENPVVGELLLCEMLLHSTLGSGPTLTLCDLSDNQGGGNVYTRDVDGDYNQGRCMYFTCPVVASAGTFIITGTFPSDQFTVTDVRFRVYRLSGADLADPVEVSDTTQANDDTWDIDFPDTTVPCFLAAGVSCLFGSVTTPSGWDSQNNANDLHSYIIEDAPAGAYDISAALEFGVDHAGSVIAIKGVAGDEGEVFEQELAGELTLSAVVAQTALKASTGALTFAGSITRTVLQVKTGALTLAGAVVKAVTKLTTGASTYVGTASNTAIRPTTGAVTFAGAEAQAVTKRLTGSVAPGGAIRSSVAQALVAALALAGGLSKAVTTLLAGSLTLSGAIAQAKVLLQTLTASLTLSAATRSTITKLTAGSLASSSTIVSLITKRLASAFTPSGATQNTASGVQELVGSLSTAGVLAHVVNIRRTGALELLGTLSKLTRNASNNTVSFAGSSGGSQTLTLFVDGALLLASQLRRAVSHTLSGAYSSAGAVAKSVANVVTGGLAPTSSSGQTFPLFVVGILTFSGSILSTIGQQVGEFARGILRVTGISRAVTGTSRLVVGLTSRYTRRR